MEQDRFILPTIVNRPRDTLRKVPRRERRLQILLSLNRWCKSWREQRRLSCEAMESHVTRANVTGPRNMIAWHPPIDSYNRGRIVFINLHPCLVTQCRRLARQVLAEVARQNVTRNPRRTCASRIFRGCHPSENLARVEEPRTRA